MTGRHSVKDNLIAVQAQVEEQAQEAGHEVHLVAVSKTKPDEDLLAAYNTAYNAGAATRRFYDKAEPQVLGAYEKVRGFVVR